MGNASDCLIDYFTNYLTNYFINYLINNLINYLMLKQFNQLGYYLLII